MKPIRLEITGLQSFVKKQIIDFDKLTSLGLFGIFGETGSGKSTILDAIILAIFDEIPRTMGGKGKNIRPCLNTNSDILYIYFKFSLGDNIFEITRSYKKRFSKKGIEKFEQINPILKMNSVIIADTVKSVENQIMFYFGMSVNDFTRSVVLPQGKFSEFLKLRGLEKMSMLESIFDLEKYGINLTNKLKIKNEKIKNELLSLENQIKGKGNFSLEDVDNLKENLNLANVEYNKISDEKIMLQNEFVKLDRLKNLVDKFNLYKENLIKLQENESIIKNYKISLENHKKSLEFKKTINEIDILKSEIKTTNYNFLKLKSKIIKDNSEINHLNNLEFELVNTLKIIDENLNEFKIDYQKLEDIRQIISYHKEFDSFNNQISIINNDLNEIKFEKTKLFQSKNKKNLILSEFYEKLKNFQPFDISNKILLENEIKNLKARFMFLDKQAQKKIEFEKQYNENIILEKTIRLQIENNNKNIQLLQQKNIENLSFQISQYLCDNQPCPVCGAKHHPNPATNKHIFDNEIFIKLCEKNDNLKLEHSKLSSTLILLENEIKNLKTEENICITKNNLIQKENELIQLNIKENDCLKKEQFLKENINILLKDIENINHFIIDKENQYNKNFEKQTNIALNLKKIENKLKNYSFQYKSLTSLIELQKILENNDKIYREYLDKKTKIEHSIREIKDKNFNILKQINENNILLTTLKTTLLTLENNTNIKQNNLNEQLEINSLSINNIDENILSEIDFQTFASKISEHDTNFIRYTNLLEDINLQINNKHFDINYWHQIQLSIKELHIKEQELFKIITEHTQELKRIKKLSLEIKDLTHKIKQLSKEQDNILFATKKFSGKKFVKYLARKRLNYIVYDASKKLQKITKGRYLLTINNDCDFNIMDTYNENIIRDCSTLSGGETFIVSLVLALALSNQLQLKGKVQLEFFFLDEGFGTLDSILLDRVIEILEDIRWTEKIKIGIISHVNDLKIRIPHILEVTAAIPGISGSTVKII